MKLIPLIFVLLVTGCSACHYSHETLNEKGHVTGRYQVDMWQNGMDRSAESVNLVLADGTRVQMIAPASKPDATLIGAATAISQSLVSAGAFVLRMFGI